MSNQKKRILDLLARIKLQLFIIAIIAILNVSHWIGLSPSFEELLSLLGGYFNQNGYYLVAICSFLENIIGVSSYFPGSVVILSTMALTHGQISKAIITFLFIYVPSILANLANYFIGRTIKSKEEVSLPKNLWLWFFGTMWHPQFAAITSIQAGSRNIPFKKFFILYLTNSFFWNLFWGITMYNLGSIGDTGGLFQYIFIIYLIGWTSIDIYKFYK